MTSTTGWLIVAIFALALFAWSATRGMNLLWWPRWWTFRSKLRQSAAVVLGFPAGAGLPMEARCPHCGAPARAVGGVSCPARYDRAACTNWLCANWVPF